MIYRKMVKLFKAFLITLLEVLENEEKEKAIALVKELIATL